MRFHKHHGFACISKAVYCVVHKMSL